MVVETDSLVAIINDDDKYHNAILNLLNTLRALGKYIFLSPYSIYELFNLAKIKKDKFGWVYRLDISEVKRRLKLFLIITEPPRFEDFIGANNLKGTFFDSLHASYAMRKRQILISFDNIYSHFNGLLYINTHEALKFYEIELKCLEDINSCKSLVQYKDYVGTELLSDDFYDSNKGKILKKRLNELFSSMP
ncbi:PIN domain-containing protein [Acidianus sp. RZ1]|uniref:PIN domain-containing protein n=1 Tax=Acidianus sp. RZ1 TaxID=1540082 RepID=UPI00353054C7